MSEDPITLEEIKTIPIVETLIRVGNANLEVMGFTEHGFRHISLVSS
ncbi:MAG: phosphohydrolase, partial [Syntrophomonadaceae bacterium]|nr:phosphohydrolase [Syntrophomonadaceae bacterium]